MNAKCSILSLALLAAWLSAAGTEPTNVVVHWQSTSPSGASRIATAAYYDGLGRHVASVAEDASPDGGDISPDPLCEQTPEISPYAYCAADPVNFIDPTGMTIEYGDSVTDEQRNMLEQYRQEMSKSLLFKMIYDFLNSEEAGIFTINFGNIESPGQFVEGDIIYRKNSHGTNLYYMAFVEEIIHAFQYAHGQMDDPTINKEYEARLLTMWILGEVETLAPSVEGCLGKYLDQIYSGRLVGIGNPELLRTEYQEYGKMFVDYFKRTYPTDANYHVPANEPSRLFISIFQFLFNKILKTCRY